MGNDIEVFERENDEIESIFWKNHGPKDESAYGFFRRGFDAFCNSISDPKRSAYTRQDLFLNGYDTREFKLLSHRGNTLRCCHWINLNKIVLNYPFPICILYLHTNTRNLSDACEVELVCSKLGADLVSFDFEGAGLSDGSLSPRSYRDIMIILEWIRCSQGSNVNVIVWARGMATAAAIEFSSSTSVFPGISMLTQTICKNAVKFIVLDTPFQSIKKLVDDCIARFTSEGYSIPLSIVSVFSSMVRRALSSRMDGVDPFEVEPVRHVSSIEVPAFVVASTRDDYISFDHGVCIAESWGGHCRLRMYELPHFAKRPEEMFEMAVSEINSQLHIGSYHLR